MTEQITVPRATWDALINALENHPGNYKLTKSECAAMAEVITAANAVSNHTRRKSVQPQTKQCGLCGETDQSAQNACTVPACFAREPQAQGEAHHGK